VRFRCLLALSGLIFSVFAYGHFASACQAQPVATSRVNVHLVTDEAEAVLAILAKRKANQVLINEDWQRVFTRLATQSSG
jgi:hypothetical protein